MLAPFSRIVATGWFVPLMEAVVRFSVSGFHSERWLAIKLVSPPTKIGPRIGRIARSANRPGATQRLLRASIQP